MICVGGDHNCKEFVLEYVRNTLLRLRSRPFEAAWRSPWRMDGDDSSFIKKSFLALDRIGIGTKVLVLSV